MHLPRYLILRSLVRTLAVLGGAFLALPVAAQEDPGASAVREPVVDEAATTAAGPWIRVGIDSDDIVHLEMASRSYVRREETAPVVHLVSAMHIADRHFYEAAQRRLDAMGLVLYEGVRPGGSDALPEDATDVERDKATRHRMEVLKALACSAFATLDEFPADVDGALACADKGWEPVLHTLRVDGWGTPFRWTATGVDEEGQPVLEIASSGPDRRAGVAGDVGDDILASIPASAAEEAAPGADLYGQFAEILGLVAQSDVMDTTRENWRSSDMSMDKLQDRIDAAGGDASMLFALLRGNSSTARMLDMALGLLRASKAMAARVKLLTMEQLAASESPGPEARKGRYQGLGMVVKNADAVMKVILEGRNGVVLADLAALLASENPPATIAVFYGAAHMPDMERRLRGELGFEVRETTWTRVMSLDPRDVQMGEAEMKRLRARLPAWDGKQPAKASGD